MKKKLLIIGKGHQSFLISSDKYFIKKYSSIDFIEISNKKKSSNQLKNIDTKKSEFLIAIGNNYLREKISLLLEKKFKTIQWATYIAKSSNIKNKVKVFPGSMIMENVLLNNNVIISKHVLINSGSIIEHDNKFDDYSSCGPGVVTGGEVKVGKKSFIGLGARIKDKIEIKKNSIIGLGSIVINNCKANSIYIGSPAKLIKKNNKKSHF